MCSFIIPTPPVSKKKIQGCRIVFPWHTTDPDSITVTEGDRALPQAPALFEQWEGVNEALSVESRAATLPFGRLSRETQRGRRGALGPQPGPAPTAGWQLQLLLFPCVWLLILLSLGYQALSQATPLLSG